MDPLGKLGGTNGNTSCLFTKFGPFARDDCVADGGGGGGAVLGDDNGMAAVVGTAVTQYCA